MPSFLRQGVNAKYCWFGRPWHAGLMGIWELQSSNGILVAGTDSLDIKGIAILSDNAYRIASVAYAVVYGQMGGKYQFNARIWRWKADEKKIHSYPLCLNQEL
ncbi:hypothetical protein BOTNAR_0317g00130 [Botryotinia narcissicola]|uniref:Uncharacterized protein n=1 Tax=Botryotinia narcissicola TaxID=278944 RepID=A0A4Z1HU65_9HELO|nr:hypothetical protein BOTNAR_0317g00130 [Botryotinia narcissicola]